MNLLDQWFPYQSYRPGQEEMLRVSAEYAASGGLLLIDAPTGSGKSSVVSALLNERNGRLIIVAVRTISQLTTYVRELDLIRKKQSSLKYSYLIGKSAMCPLGGMGDVYHKCETVKMFSTALIKERAERGSLNPFRDPVIIQQIKKNDPDHPILCPFFIRSKTAVTSEKGGGIRIIPSEECRRLADKIAGTRTDPQGIDTTCDGICPYEVMVQASQHVDVLICNYHHLFDDQIREQLYLNLQKEPGDIILLLDEAHNCGDVMQDIHSVSLDQQALEQADRDITTLRREVKDLEAVRRLFPQISRFMDGLKRSPEIEDWFDPTLFSRMILKESFYTSLEEVVDNLMKLNEAITEANSKRGDYRTTGIERLCNFLYRMNLALQGPSYLTIYHKDQEKISLEVRSIDSAPALSALVKEHHATVLISGTLSPLESYEMLFFRTLTGVRTGRFSLPNAFPRENRQVLAASDITSAFSMRQDADNAQRITRYIQEFSRYPGNLAVYFPSYQTLETAVRDTEQFLDRHELFVEPKDSGEAQELLSRFMNLPKKGKAGILFAVCGGKCSEGLDYRGDMLTGAMVFGLPLAPWNRVRQMIIDYYVQKYGQEGRFLGYTLPALNKVQQALGRVLRTPQDKGILIFGEKRFLDEQIRKRLPSWIQEELTPVTIETFPGFFKP